VDEGFHALAKSMSNQHRGKTDHSQFMRPSCERLPSSPRTPQSKKIPDILYGGKDASDDRRSKAIDKTNRGPLNELQRMRSADKEIDGGRFPKSPPRANQEPKEKGDGLSVSTTPPSPTRTRPLNGHFRDRVPTISDGKEKPQRPALHSSNTTPAELGRGVKRSATDKSNLDTTAETLMDSANVTLFVRPTSRETSVTSDIWLDALPSL
jgi:hypothetical protein